MILVGGNCEKIATLEDGAYQALLTSPPYWAPPKGKSRGGLRKYGDAVDEIGAEPTLDLFCEAIVRVMRAAWPKLRDDATAWVNLGDSYSADGEPNMVPFEVARALRSDGWCQRAMLPWIKFSGLPESVQSRPCVAHEYVLFLTKRPSGYFYDADAVRVPASANSHGAPTANPGAKRAALQDIRSSTLGQVATMYNPAGRSLRSSDLWRAGAREAGEALLAAADGQAIGLVTNDAAPAALVVNPKGSGIPHFAMWPTQLVAPMVLASTPEAGCCSACGAPWRRVVERSLSGLCDGRRPERAFPGSQHKVRGGDPTSVTIGFAPSCTCNAPPKPARILDPFAGVGTTLAVAEALGREAVGCELYQKNADLYPERAAIVAKEVADYLRERGEGDKIAIADSDKPASFSLFDLVLR